MVKRRNLLIVALLTFITLGIYGIYWLYATRKEIVAINGRPKSIPRVLTLFMPWIIFIALILVAVPLVLSSDGSEPASYLILIAGILLIISTFVVSVWWFYRYSQAASAIINESKSFLFAIWLLCTLFGIFLIWVIVVQYHLNKLASQMTSPEENRHDSPTIAAPPPGNQQPAKQV